MNTYSIEFSESQQQEIISLGFEPFEPDPAEPMTRGQWMAIAHMALGKACRIGQGDYGLDLDDPDITEVTDELWIGELNEIAEKILEKFQPGDGQI